jgi:hypothetical protein
MEITRERKKGTPREGKPQKDPSKERGREERNNIVRLGTCSVAKQVHVQFLTIT